MAYLLITNDIEPYYRDVVSVMAQRYGCIYRFRYERKPDFDLVKLANPMLMEHHNALIVLRCRQTGQFIPIRRASVERVFDSQRLVVVRFAVLDFPDPTLKSQWPRIQHILEAHKAESKPGESLCPLIFETSDSEIDNIVGAPVEDGERSGIIDVDRWTYVIDSIWL